MEGTLTLDSLAGLFERSDWDQEVVNQELQVGDTHRMLQAEQ